MGIVGAIFSRILYYKSGQRLNDGYLADAILLDILSLGLAVISLLDYWDVISIF